MMKLTISIDSTRDKVAPTGARPASAWLLLFGFIVILLVTKVLWGFWQRDLTFGDTSSYFQQAVRWHVSGQANIVWSPLYVMYYGSWLRLTEDAAVATFLHRVGLILLTTGLVGWLGLVSLPRVLALLLVFWWVALPIHYDTMYEVHLFGAIPLIAMAIIALRANENWRMALLIGVALASTVLIRNEYVLVLGVFIAFACTRLGRVRSQSSGLIARAVILRHALVLLAVGSLIIFSYSASNIKSAQIQEVATHKHAHNMCQVYAFGYQQRNPAWTGSPWMDCYGLMEAQFGQRMPSLKEMALANPKAVVEHFLWNLSLTKAGLEVLLFNATGSRDNPDYAPVHNVPVLPELLFGLTFAIAIAGAIKVYRRRPEDFLAIRSELSRMVPVLVAAGIMATAIVLTQRPRPSYLLGAGILYVWLVLVFGEALLNRQSTLHSNWALTALAMVLFLFVPSYQHLRDSYGYGSGGFLHALYEELKPHAERLCNAGGIMFVGEYSSEIENYLCSPLCNTTQNMAASGTLSLASLPLNAFEQTDNIVAALDRKGAGALVIDPIFFMKHPGLENCASLRDSLIKHGWTQLAYSLINDRQCIAAYARPARTTKLAH